MVQSIIFIIIVNFMSTKHNEYLKSSFIQHVNFMALFATSSWIENERKPSKIPFTSLMGFFVNRKVLCRILPASTIIWNSFFFSSVCSPIQKTETIHFSLAKDAARAFDRFFCRCIKWNETVWDEVNESTRCEIHKI